MAEEIVNGALLPQFNGKTVSVVGLVTNTNPNRLSFDMKTVDDITVKVILRKPPTGIIEGHVEVHGVAQGRTVHCEHLVKFPLENSLDFDVASYQRLCTLIHSIPDLWKTSN